MAIFNGDNLPPEGAVAQLKTTKAGMLAFAQSHLGLPIERTKAFAIVEGSVDAGVHTLLEKPSDEDVERLRDEHGEVWVSMNVFRLPYEALLAGAHRHPFIQNVRNENCPPLRCWLQKEMGPNCNGFPVAALFWT